MEAKHKCFHKCLPLWCQSSLELCLQQGMTCKSLRVVKSSLSLNINMMHALASRHGWKCMPPYQVQNQTPEDSVCLERVRGGNCPSLLHSQATWGHKEEACKYIFSRQVRISPFPLTFLLILLLTVTSILPKFTCKQGDETETMLLTRALKWQQLLPMFPQCLYYLVYDTLDASLVLYWLCRKPM